MKYFSNDFSKETILSAIDGSIKKHKRIINNGAIDKGSKDCPLCGLFMFPYACNGCPIFERTGRKACRSTPYTEWIEHFRKEHGRYIDIINGMRIVCSQCEIIENRELKFLEELRDEYIKKKFPSVDNPDTARLNWLEKQDGCALISDDNGRWAVVCGGIQTVPDDEPEDVWTAHMIEKDDWKLSVRKAIDDGIRNEKE